jgi:hypothetical protein
VPHAEQLFRNEVITLDMLTPHVSKKFRVLNIQGDEYNITLKAAEPLDIKDWPKQFRAPFSLTFHSAPELPHLPQGQFLVQCSGSPAWGIFMTPIITIDRSQGQLYQAVFA